MIRVTANLQTENMALEIFTLQTNCTNKICKHQDCPHRHPKNASMMTLIDFSPDVNTAILNFIMLM